MMRPMASRTKAAVPTWFRCSAGLHNPYVFGPAETIAAWPGSAPTGRFTLHFIYWQPFLSLLPPELTPQGDPHGPTLLAASADEAASLIERIGAILGAQHRGMVTKRDKKSHTTRFVLQGARWCALMCVPETQGDVAHAAVGTSPEPLVWEAGCGPVLLAVMQHGQGLFARTIDDDVVFVDTAAEDPDELGALVLDKRVGQDHGIWRFEALVVAQSAFSSATDLKGIDDSDTAVAAFAAALGKRSAVEIKHKDRDQSSHTAVLPIASGNYHAITGGGPLVRWVRFSPA